MDACIRLNGYVAGNTRQDKEMEKETREKKGKGIARIESGVRHPTNWRVARAENKGPRMDIPWNGRPALPPIYCIISSQPPGAILED